MSVELVAQTFIRPEFTDSTMIKFTDMDNREKLNPSMSPDILAEAAGRICYASYHLPNEKTKENADYLQSIKEKYHFSVLEHSSFTFLITGVSRVLLAEISRHRHHSFSVRSQRYCNESDSRTIIPPVIKSHMDDHAVHDAMEDYIKLQHQSRRVYKKIQGALLGLGLDRKTANDAARYVLLEGTETELFITANGRSWIDFLSKRDSEGAAIEIRNLAGLISEALKKAAPHTFNGEK